MRKWNSVAIAFVTVLALLIPLGGCGSDSKDTATTTAKVENQEQVFKDILQKAAKAANRNTAVEDVYAMDASSAAALMTTPDHDGKALIKKGQRAQPDDLKRENIQVSNIQTRGALMAADISWTAVFTEQGQKKQVPVSGTIVLRNENGVWKQLVMGIVEVTPIKSIEVVSGGMRNVSIHGNVGKTFSGEQVIFLSFKNNSTTNYSFGWVQPPRISAVTDAGEVPVRALPQYDIVLPNAVFRLAQYDIFSQPHVYRLAGELATIGVAFPEAKGTIREIKFTDFHILNANGLPTDFDAPTLTLRLTM